MTTVLVTGATGTVGSEVISALADLDADATIRAAVRRPDEAAGGFGDDVELARFDFEKPETWGTAFDGVDRLFLLLPSGRVDVSRVTDAVDAAIRVGVERVVYLSVLGAERNPLLPHRRIERHVESAGVEHTFLRASFFMQNLGEIHRPDVVDHHEIFVPAGDGRTSFVDARDVGAVAARVLASADPGEDAYDLTGPEALDYRAVAAIFGDVLDRPIEYADPSIPAFVRRMRARGEPLAFVAVMVAVYATARFGLAGRVTDDVERVLGRPPCPLREYVADNRDVFEADAKRSVEVRPVDAPPDALIGAMNPLLRRLLTSPLHGLVSHRLLLLTVTGRRTGRAYIFPVAYEGSGDELVVTTHHSNWWKNLRGGAPVAVRLRGTERRGTAEVTTDDDAVAAHVHDALRRHGPGYGRRLGVEIEGGRLPTVDDLRDAVGGVVLVRITLG